MVKTNPRTLQTKERIKSTLLELMQTKPFYKITVTEICKCLEINRGTFYLHYCDLMEVLEELVDDALCSEAVLEPAQCSLAEMPYYWLCKFCHKIHTHPEYGAIFFDDSLMEPVIEKIAAKTKQKYVDLLIKQSKLTVQEAETLFYFQLNGCLAINKRIYRNGSKDWKQSRNFLNEFIQNGLRWYMK